LNTYQAYEVLNLQSSASFDEIKDAYRKLALELHPDKNKKQDEGTKFKKITEAYHILKLDMKHGAYRLHKNPEGKSYTDKQTSRKQNYLIKKYWNYMINLKNNQNGYNFSLVFLFSTRIAFVGHVSAALIILLMPAPLMLITLDFGFI